MVVAINESLKVVLEEPQKVSLQTLQQEFVVEIDDPHWNVMMPPSPSCYTSVKENLLPHKFSNIEDSIEFYTCEPKDVEVTSVVEVDDDLFIFCCG